MSVPFQDGHELERGESSAHIHVGDIPVQLAEDARVVSYAIAFRSINSFWVDYIIRSKSIYGIDAQ